MFCKAALLALMCAVVLVSSQTLEEQENSFSQSDAALLEPQQATATREKRFLFKKKALGIGLGLGAGLGFVKGYKLGKLSQNRGGLNYGLGNSAQYPASYGHTGNYAPTYDTYSPSGVVTGGHGSSYYPNNYNTNYYQTYTPPQQSYTPSQQTYTPPQQTYYPAQQTYTPQLTYGNPSYNDYYSNYNQGVAAQSDGYNYNKPSAYNLGLKTFTVGAQWSGGIGKGSY